MKLKRIFKNPLLATIAAILLLSAGSLSAQENIVNNIKPVAQVCLAGNACVGSKAGGETGSAAPSVAPAQTAATTQAQTQTPAAAAPAAEPAVAAFDAAATYQQSCFACHGTGAAGAPKPGDSEAWEERMSKGMDAVMATVITGVGAMPPKGMCMNCSDTDLRAIVDFMLEQ